MSDFYKWREQRNTSTLLQRLATNPVAYFCMEFAVPENLPIYAGGLGVLAGDYVMEASQQSFPMVGVGLFYSEKCIPGEMGGYCIPNDPVKLGLIPVNDKLGNRVKGKLPMGNNQVHFQAWLYDRGTVPVYLLDTNVEENNIEERDICRLLYTSSPQTRLQQELLLGIGGVRLLEKINIKPSIFHMNEGHSAFLSYELAFKEMQKSDKNFQQAFKVASKKIAFTNHTLVVGGHDVFDNKLVESMIGAYAKEIGVDVAKLIEKGSDEINKKVFSATFLALNAASRVNAVSKLHCTEANKLWPSYDTCAVTNGVNIDRWDKVGLGQNLQKKHKAAKSELLKHIKKETGVRWFEDELLVGWARRIVSYKRPRSIFDDMAQLKKMATNHRRPLRIVFSGQPHYQDDEGVAILAYLRKLSKEELRGNMVFLDKYSIDISTMMISGCDVWLNTPIVGLEACGTSGIKAALNGVLPCSTDDGWMPEVDLEKIGFKLDDKYITLSLMQTLSEKIIPLYYQYRSGSRMGSIWSEKMEWSRAAMLHGFGSDRMLRDYIEKIYKPLLNQS